MFTLQFGGEFETLMDNSLTKGVGSPRHARPEQPRLSFPSRPFLTLPNLAPFPPSREEHSRPPFRPALSHMRSRIDQASCAIAKDLPHFSEAARPAEREAI